VRADRGGGAAAGHTRAVGGRDGGGRGERRDAPSARDGESDACTVFVGNLPYEVTWQVLKDHMAKAGQVAHADVKSGSDGRSMGIGIVRYHSAEDAATAIESLSETNLGGRDIFVRADRGGGPGGAAGRGGGRGLGRGGGRGGGRGRGKSASKGGRGGRDESTPMSVNDLDNDLDSYFSAKKSSSEAPDAAPAAE